MKKILLWCCWGILLLTGAATVQGGEERKLGIDLDTTFVSQYIWRGYDVLDDHAAFQPSVNFDLFQTGFSLNIWGSFALSKGFEDLDELDYTLAWGKTLCEDKIDFSINYIYYDFPNTGSDEADSQEWGIGITLPDVCAIGPGSMAPSWYCGYLFEAHSEGPDHGWFNIFGLAYDLPVKPLLPNQEEQSLGLTFELIYDDGAFGAESGFSCATACLSTGFEVKGISFTPAINYQWSMEDTVNDEDEFWGGISIGYSF